jgi:hypothetical protein
MSFSFLPTSSHREVYREGGSRSQQYIYTAQTEKRLCDSADKKENMGV